MHDDRTTGDNGEDTSKDKSVRRFEAHEEDFAGANDESLAVKLTVLLQEHSDLDVAIGALENQAHQDRLAIARLKKKKLQIKDQMQAIKDQMTPDIIA